MQPTNESVKNNSSLIRLLIVQAQVAFNDNAAKLTLAGLSNLVLAQEKVPVGACLLGWLAPKTNTPSGSNHRGHVRSVGNR